MKYKFKTPPYKHQLTALEKSWNKETYAYFMEMGTGKTKVLIDNLAMLYDKGKINGAFITNLRYMCVLPLSCKSQRLLKYGVGSYMRY